MRLLSLHTLFLPLLALLVPLTALMPLSDELFVADADVRREAAWGAAATLRAACVIVGADTPAYRLSYQLEDEGETATKRPSATPNELGGDGVLVFHVCAWRPWRVGSFIVIDECRCDT